MRSPSPRHATSRDPGRPSWGPAVGKLWAALGRPLMPWQRQVFDTALEVDADGQLVHRLVVVSTPRQSGKSFGMMAKKTHKALAVPDRRLWLTAQTGKDARDLWSQHREYLDQTRLARYFKAWTSNGHERLVFRNGSQIAPHPPTRAAMHGKQSDDNDIDEGWVFDEVDAAALLQAIVPTQLTRPGAQTWVWSTQGDADSVWFSDLCDRGRAGDPNICYFEHAIPPDADPTDLGVIAAHHPAYGHTVTMDALRAARAQITDDNEFARAFGNVRTASARRLFTADELAAVMLPADTPLSSWDGPAGWSLDVSPDRDAASIAVTRLSSAGRPVTKVVEHRPGEAWVADRLVELLADTPRRAVIVDRRGPAGGIAEQLDRAGVDVIPAAEWETRAACGDTYSGIRNGTLGLVRSHALDAALDAAIRRPSGDAWVWDRRKGGAPVTPLYAVSLSALAVHRAPAPAPAPVVVT